MAINVNQLKNSAHPRLSQLSVNSKTYELWDDTARLAIQELQDNFDGLVGDLDNLNSYADTGFQSMMHKVGTIYNELTKIGQDNNGLADSVLDSLFNKFNGDSANSAIALTTNGGSSTNPVYFSGGKPVAVKFTTASGGPTANATLTHGGTFTVPQVSQAAGGQVTVTNRTMTMPAATTWSTLSGKPSTFAPSIGTTATTAAAGNHTHTTTIATSTGTNALTLAFGTKYALNAGGTSFIFTMPAAPKYTAASGGPTADATLSSQSTFVIPQVAQATNGQITVTNRTMTMPHGVSLAKDATTTGGGTQLEYNTYYKLTGGGSTVVFKTPVAPAMPTVNNGTLTIAGQSGSKAFTANSSSNVTATVSLYEKTAPSSSNNYTLEIGVKLA